MTDTYYEQEKHPVAFEDQVLTIETALQAADPATAQQLLDDAGAWLGEMYEQAKQVADQTAIVAIETAWNNMNAIKVMADTSADVAHSAVEGMKAAIEQRDDIAQELAELTEAVENMDSDHPLVSDLIDDVREQVEEHFMEDGLHVQCPGCAVSEQDFPIDHDAMNYLCMTLFGEAEDISPMLKEELATFIHGWVKKAQSEEAASGKYNWRVTPDNIDDFDDEEDEFEDEAEE